MKKLMNLNGAKTLSKNEQKNVFGGGPSFEIQRGCVGSCDPNDSNACNGNPNNCVVCGIGYVGYNCKARR